MTTRPTTDPTPPTPETARGPGSGALLAALVLATAAVTVDNTVLNVALPSISTNLHAGTSQLQWIVNAYSLLFGGLLLSAGTAADRLGRRRVLLGGLAAFAAASALVVLVHSAPELIALRAVVGAAAAFVMPSTLAILVRSFAGPARAKAVGLWGAVTAAGFAAGPVIGGALLSAFPWQSVFLVNVPIAFAAIIVCRRFVPADAERLGGHADIAGTVLSVATMSALVDALVSGPVHGWTSASVLLPAVAAAIAGTGFVLRELRAEHPMVDVRFLASVRFGGPAIAEAVLMFSTGGALFLITQQLQLVLGYSPIEAGLLVAPAAGGVILASPLVARFGGRTSARASAAVGLALVSAGLVIVAAGVRHGYAPLATGLVVFGVGMRITMTPVALAVVDALPPARAGMGSALNDTFQEVGSALGVAVLGCVFNAAYRAHLPSVVPAAVKSSLGGALDTHNSALISAARAAFESGMASAVWVCAAIVAVVALIGWRTLPARVLSEDDELLDSTTGTNPSRSPREAVPGARRSACRVAGRSSAHLAALPARRGRMRP